MINYLCVLLLVILNSILFFDKELGISVIIFTIPLLLLLITTLKNNNRINNKKGFLFLIPIILLSLTYLIFDNTLFKYLNIAVIPILYILMYIYVIKPTNNLEILFDDLARLIFEPLKYIGNSLNDATKSFKTNKKLSDKSKKNIKSFIIVIPILILIIYLLSSADLIFKDMFSFIINFFDGLIDSLFSNDVYYRILIAFILFTYISGTLYYLINIYDQEKRNTNVKPFNDNNTIKILLISLNIIYIIFDIIQIKSLLFHKIDSNISYSTYARQGFFQLAIVSIINISLILIAKRKEIKDDNNNKLINIMCYLTLLLTFVIILSSGYRMHLYELKYGYTTLRLLVYVALVTETILFIPTILYIKNNKFNILKYYMITCISIYTLINFINIDYLIAKRNIYLYEHSNYELDIDYLKNYGTDNINLLIKLNNNTKDKKIKKELKQYFNYMQDHLNNNSWQEYNISKHNAYIKIKDLH